VYIPPLEVATFLTPELIKKSVKKNYDILILPGLVDADLSEIENTLGIKTYRGPKDIADLDILLENIEKIPLSKDIPADEFLVDYKKKKALEEFEKLKSPDYIRETLKTSRNILIGELPVGKDFPIRIVAEIVDISSKNLDEIIKIAKYYIRSGADIIDLGLNKEDEDKIREVVPELKKLRKPLSIDTLNKKNIECAIEEGIDLILSFDESMIKNFKRVEQAAVILPMKKGVIPDNPDERIKFLENNIKLAKERNFQKVIADPILKPINFGLSDSIIAYRKFGRLYHNIPMLMGIGNVTELIDADSIGINAVLCGIASECGADLVFTTEASHKTKGCITELSKASKMMYLAKKRGSSPKDLGIDLLVHKKKK